MLRSANWRKAGALLAVLLIPLGSNSCFLCWTHRPNERIDPKTPEIALTLRFVDAERKEEVHPLLVWVIYERFHGRTTEMMGKQGFDELYLTKLMDGSTIRLPHYVPAPGEEIDNYRYYIRLRMFMSDSGESCVYFVKAGKITGPASLDGRSEFPIPLDGRVQIEVPFRRVDSSESEIRRSERLLGSIEHLSGMTSELATKLDSKDVGRLAAWVLASVDRLKRLRGDSPDLRRMQEHWKMISEMPVPVFRTLEPKPR
jgi:hypothetical protein